MKIKSVELNIFRDHIFCDCGEEYKFGGAILASYPPIYPHICPKCGDETSEDRLYPSIRYEEKLTVGDE